MSDWQVGEPDRRRRSRATPILPALQPLADAASIRRRAFGWIRIRAREACTAPDRHAACRRWPSLYRALRRSDSPYYGQSGKLPWTQAAFAFVPAQPLFEGLRSAPSGPAPWGGSGLRTPVSVRNWPEETKVASVTVEVSTNYFLSPSRRLRLEQHLAQFQLPHCCPGIQHSNPSRSTSDNGTRRGCVRSSPGQLLL